MVRKFLMPLSTIFQWYHGGQLFDGRNHSRAHDDAINFVLIMTN
jgi:hypothetical protein